MKLSTYSGDGTVQVGLVDDTHMRVRALIGCKSVLELAEYPAERLRSWPLGEARDLREVSLLAPIPEPRRNLVCVGWNYLAHFEEGKHNRPPVELPAHPSFFTKATTTVCGPFDELPVHSLLTQKLDWEAELAVIIGKGGRDIAPDDALGHVFGYAVANDVSARDVQRAHGGQWFKGKSLDRSCPLGPWIVTADELQPFDLAISCRVNGQTMQRASTRQMIFPVPRVIAELSAGMTLLPGDIILTGTPEGIGGSREPPVFLRAGDLLETEIAGIGVLRNRIGS